MRNRWTKRTLCLVLLLVTALTASFTNAQYDWGVQPDLLGDANGDKRITALDATAVLKHCIGAALITTLQQKASADATEDGAITASDAAAILRFVVGVDSMPPGLWTAAPTRVPTPTPTITPVPQTSPRVTPTASPVPTASPSPTPSPILVGDNGFLLFARDPNYARMSAFYYNTAANTVATNATHCKNLLGWVYMSFTGIQNKTKTYSYAPDYAWSNAKTYTISYPIMYDGDFYYNSHDECGNASDSGSIYAWYGSLTQNIVIEGHNSRSTRLRFHHLHSLQNAIISKATNGKASGTYRFNISMFGYWDWQIFAMYETGANEPASTYQYNRSANCGNAVSTWAATQLAKSEVDFGVSVSDNDRFMTLITCGDVYYTDASVQNKLYIFLKYVG